MWRSWFLRVQSLSARIVGSGFQAKFGNGFLGLVALCVCVPIAGVFVAMRIPNIYLGAAVLMLPCLVGGFGLGRLEIYYRVSRLLNCSIMSVAECLEQVVQDVKFRGKSE